MNSRDRVLAAINKQPKDKIPTSMRCTPEALQMLQKYDSAMFYYEKFQQHCLLKRTVTANEVYH